MNTDERGTKRFSVAARTRMAVALMVAGCLALVGLAVTGQAATPERLEFVQVGHWVYNDAAQSAFHVDGSTNRVDARADVPGANGSQVAQGDGSGYVVERNRITEFDKATLSVEESTPPPAPETPFVMEIAGGPYLVYRNAGQIVRLGDPAATVPAGGPLSRPVATTDGTVWAHRADSGSICELPKGAAVMTCPAQLPPGHGGGLTLVGDSPVVLDTTGDSLHRVGPDGLGEALPLGIKLSPSAQVANSAVGGRLAIADPERNQLHLIDISGLDQDHPSAKPISVELAKGSRFNGPLSSSNVVAMIDETRGEVLTYDADGKLKSTAKVPGQGTPPRLAKGEDNRIYVDSSDGSHVLVVNGDDGTVVDVDVDKAASSQTAGAPSADPEPSGDQPPPRQQDQRQQAPPNTQQAPPPVAKATPPGAPRKVSATSGDGSIKVSWSPAADNGARITAYRVTWTGGSTRVGGSSRGTTISGLTNGTPYVITVAAENSAGIGAGAGAKAVIPGPANRPAGAPVVTANATAAGKVSVSWTQPDLRGGTLVHYLVSVTGKGQRTVSASSAEFTGVTGTATVTVRAVTKFGSGSTLTGATGSRKVTVPAPSDPPTITITGVRVGTGLIVDVTANGKGASATCQAKYGDAVSASKACSGATSLPINNVGYIGAVTVTATIKTSGGTGSDSWTGSPSMRSGIPGGSLIWLGPMALVGLRRRKEKELL
ncbi:fibronectin type III domain-containing protein [Amycolatopsis decaplanina]|nr:fibronectin type III domain-containing protein [Amycolatopsis decaplanina]